MEDQERKNRRIGWLTSIGVHAGLVLLFLFMMAWRAPNPPLPEYGIELNFGLDNQGAGEVQPETSSQSEAVDNQEQEEQVQEQEQSVPEQPQEEVKPQETKETTEEVVAKTESPVVVKETPKESKPVETPKEKPVDPKPKKEVVEQKTETKPTTASSTETPSDNNKPASNGDDPNKAGDKGNPEGSLDAKALYGKQGGGGGGPGLELAGWNWDEIPRPRIPSNESNGKIVFEIKVDDNGEIIGYRVLERSLSIDAENACKEAIAKLTFSKKAGAVVPAISTGKITFTVTSR